MAKIQAIRGMNDVLPEETTVWQYLEGVLRTVLSRYAYREIRFPVLEPTQLFKRSIGEVTDIVEKEMYSFEDRNGDNLSLRPEGTAGCVRAAEQHGLLYNQQQRLWYQGPMFRHERPQKGRYRQFHQLGVETYGMAGPDIDAEVILLSSRLWQELGISQQVQLEINNIGSAEDRRAFGEALASWLQDRRDELDSDSRRRLESNPLRILDSKVPQTQALLEGAPTLADFVTAESTEHYSELKQLLRSSGLDFIENPRLVRGLDYYNNAVFEWTTASLGAQGTVCAGGRYDSLVAQLGGRDTPAVGFAMGLERLILMLQSQRVVPDHVRRDLDAYLVIPAALSARGLALAETLRGDCPGLRLLSHCGGGKYNNQVKKAYNSGARIALVLEEGAESGASSVKVRWLDDSAETQLVSESELPALLNAHFSGH